MKIKFEYPAQAEAFVAAFQDREIFTLSGAGLRRQFLGSSLMRVCEYGRSYFDVEFEQIKEVAWRGPQDGLPPAGTICELRAKTGGWGKAEIKYQGNGVCVWLWVGREIDKFQLEHALSPDALLFRAIRTPEQIAAEKALEEIRKLYVEGGPGAVYDAGYRKFEIVDEQP